MTLGARWMLPLLATLFSGAGFSAGQQLSASLPEPQAAPNAIVAPSAGSLPSLARTSEPGVLVPTLQAAPPTRPTQSLAPGDAPQSTAAALARMAALAGVIFAGQVIAVRRPAGYPGSPQSAAEGLVEIAFRVDEAVRGTTAGSQFVLKEWSGLWAGGIDRYQVGQRLLLFLHAPNAQGMSSPIDGMDGALPLHGAGAAPGAADTVTTSGIWMVDLRWVQAQVLRETTRESIAAPLREADPLDAAEKSSSTGAVRGEMEGPVLSPLSPVVWRGISAMPQQSSTASLQDVLTLCRQWEQQSHAAR
jgi:hypothetical protein